MYFIFPRNIKLLKVKVEKDLTRQGIEIVTEHKFYACIHTFLNVDCLCKRKIICTFWYFDCFLVLFAMVMLRYVFRCI